ncbi:HU family DNA-binding protein [Sphingobium baderi]|uniref:Integration host factor n=1 Tax=Sphingobium baderi TaxID=1332080 RepID=A0A0S3EZP2_9SPHN|nr:HU family DNA-binding protein [Sphingobium baderi]ALR20897.1 integration host factor [Sphingobium baderi]
MTGNDIVEALSASQGISKADAKKYFDAILGLIGDAAANGEEVSFNGFGKFRVKQSAAREGRNPATGETITIRASRRVTFTAAKALKDKVND